MKKSKYVMESLNEFMEHKLGGFINFNKRDISIPIMNHPILDDEESLEFINGIDEGISLAVPGTKILRVMWPGEDTSEEIWDILEEIYSSVESQNMSSAPRIEDKSGTVYGALQTSKQPEGLLIYASIDYTENGSYYLADENMAKFLMQKYPILLDGIPEDGIDF